MFFVAVALAGCAKAADSFPDSAAPPINGENLPNYINSSSPLTFLVTFRQAEDGGAYLYYSDEIRFRCDEPFTHQYRAVCVAIIKDYPDEQGYCPAQILCLEALDEGDLTYDESAAGSDGLEILNDWITTVDDAYLTLKYSAWWGEEPVKHDFHVVAGLNPDDPYYLELRHDAHSDPQAVQSEGIVSFDINALPDTQGEEKVLTLKYRRLGGSSDTKYFGFKTRK